MPLVKAKCPNCGANLQVNSEKDAAICPYCKSAYIVEKSIASFNNSKVDKIVANTVNIYGNQTIQAYKNSDDTKFVNNKVSKGFLINIRIAEQLRKAIQ